MPLAEELLQRVLAIDLRYVKYFDLPDVIDYAKAHSYEDITSLFPHVQDSWRTQLAVANLNAT
jgi:hypothetical protein